MQIGILQSGHLSEQIQEEIGDYDILFDQLLSPLGFKLSVWNVVDMEFPDNIHTCDGWLVTGSRHGVYDPLPFIAKLEAFIRNIYSAKIPLVGICFGHQIIAQALGGRVEKFKGGWSIGAQRYEHEGKSMILNAWHQDQVVEVPSSAEVIGKSDFCENAAMVYGDHVYTLQQHPEFTRDVVDLLLQYRAPGIVPDSLISQAKDARGLDLANAEIANRIAQFFRETHHGHLG